MSKEHSQSNTRLTPNKPPPKNLSLHQQTQKAIEYYNSLRKDYLKNIKKNYIAQIQVERSSCLQRRNRSEDQRLKKKKKKKKKEIEKRKVIRDGDKKHQSKKVDYREPSSSPQVVRQKVSIQKDERSETGLATGRTTIQENLYPEGTFELKPIHQYLLSLQKTIDSFLSYQFQHRRKRSLPLEQMFAFLKTTSFGLNCRKNFRYLNVYNCNLYSQEGEYIFCLNCGNRLDERLLETRKRMSQKQIEQLLI